MMGLQFMRGNLKAEPRFGSALKSTDANVVAVLDTTEAGPRVLSWPGLANTRYVYGALSIHS